MPSLSPALLFLALLAGCAGTGRDFAPTTAQRPTVSSDTATTAAGTIELESGGAIDPGDSVDTPTVVKWGAGPRTEFFLGWSPHQEIGLPGPDADGVSDLLVGTRHRFLEADGQRPSAAFQLATSLPTGDRSQGLSSGEIDFHATAIVTQAFGDFSATAYYDAGILGNPTGGTDLEHTLALAGATTLGQRWGAFGEAAAVLDHERDVEDYLLTVGGTYALSPSLVFDVGATFGINDEAPDFQILFGFTTNLGALPFFRDSRPAP